MKKKYLILLSIILVLLLVPIPTIDYINKCKGYDCGPPRKKGIVFKSPLFVQLINLIGLKQSPEEVPTTQLYKGQAIYIQNIDHPFSGPGLETDEGVYGLYGELIEDIELLDDGTKIYVEGYKKTINRSIPESGNFNRIDWNVIDIQTYEVL